MTLSIKIARGKEYLYFQAGKESLYICPKDNPVKIKIDNLTRALEHTRERMDHYAASYKELLQLLPPKERKQYARK